MNLGEDNSLFSVSARSTEFSPHKILTNMSVAKIQPLYTVCVCLVAKSCLTLATPRTVAHQAPLSMGFSRKNTGVGCHYR